MGGGSDNTASNSYSTVGGGGGNIASGHGSTVPGGASNTASGRFSFAAGTAAKAIHNGAFVWGGDAVPDFASTADNQFLIRAPGGVGIGTNAPDQMLSVNGNASKTGGTSWAVFSDARLKDIGSRYTTGLEALTKLQPVRFRYKQDNALGITNHDEQIGFIAQEVEQVIPEAVTMMPSGYRQLSADPILWTMLNATKELKAENDDLKARVAQPEALIEKRLGVQVSKAVTSGQ